MSRVQGGSVSQATIHYVNKHLMRPFVWFPGTGYLLFRVCHLESPCWEGVGQDNVCTVFLCCLEYLISKTTSYSHTLVCHRVHHILLTQSCSQTSLNYLHRCPPSLCLQCVVSEYGEDEVRLTKLHFQSFKSDYHINVIENMSLVTSCCITLDKKQKCVTSVTSIMSDSLKPPGL